MSTTTLTPSRRVAWLGFIVVLAASVMDLLDSTIAQTAAPAIRRDLGGSYADLEWISAAYTLAMAVTLMVGSRLGDVFGRRRVLLAGIAGFVGASALCSLAPNPDALIAGRALQGAVAAIMVPQGFGLIRELFGDEGQQKAFGVFGPVMGLAAVTGPLVGGGLVNLDLLGTGWRAIFLVNVPLGLAAIAGSITSSALLAKIGRTTMHIGIVVMAFGLIVVDLVMRSAGGGLTAWDLAGPLAVTGFGMGMVFVPMFDVILAGVAPHEIGSASGLLESIQQLAMSVGIAAVGTVLFDSVGHGRGAVAFVGASDHALLLAVGFLVAACAAVFWLPKHARAAHA